MPLPPIAFYSIYEISARWGCHPADVAAYQKIGKNLSQAQRLGSSSHTLDASHDISQETKIVRIVLNQTLTPGRQDALQASVFIAWPVPTKHRHQFCNRNLDQSSNAFVAAAYGWDPCQYLKMPRSGPARDIGRMAAPARRNLIDRIEGNWRQRHWGNPFRRAASSGQSRGNADYKARGARHAGGLGGELSVEGNCPCGRAASRGMLASDSVRFFRYLFSAHPKNTHPRGDASFTNP